jgi:hypothetical protein
LPTKNAYFLQLAAEKKTSFIGGHLKQILALLILSGLESNAGFI